MTGRELIDWIIENKLEDGEVIVVSPENKYLDVESVWEGESGGGAIMLNTEERRYGSEGK